MAGTGGAAQGWQQIRLAVGADHAHLPTERAPLRSVPRGAGADARRIGSADARSRPPGPCARPRGGRWGAAGRDVGSIYGTAQACETPPQRRLPVSRTRVRPRGRVTTAMRLLLAVLGPRRARSDPRQLAALPDDRCDGGVGSGRTDCGGRGARQVLDVTRRAPLRRVRPAGKPDRGCGEWVTRPSRDYEFSTLGILARAHTAPGSLATSGRRSSRSSRRPMIAPAASGRSRTTSRVARPAGSSCTSTLARIHRRSGLRGL